MTKEEDYIERLVSFFYEIGTLRKVLRAHQQNLLSQDLTDNTASHSFRTAFIGFFLAKQLNADAEKVMKMCLFHDIEEARSGDQNWVHKRYVKIDEEEISGEQLKGLPYSEEFLEILREYRERETLEAKIAKDADLLDEIFILREYQLQGNKEAGDWLKCPTVASQQEKRMFSDLAKQIAREAKLQNPSDWWANLWTSERR